MSRIVQYCALVVQGSLALLFLGLFAYAILLPSFGMRRKILQFSAERSWSVVILYVPLAIFFEYSVQKSIRQFIIRNFGIKSEKEVFVHFTIVLAAEIVTWYAGYVVSPLEILFGCFRLAAIILINKDRKRTSTGDPHLVTNEIERSRPAAQMLRGYCYNRLRQEKSIRILALAPSSVFESPLECRLVEVSLDTSPEYVSLSYAWDSFEGTSLITCNGSTLKITRNCERALRRIRQMHGSNSVNVWVDAICIDQGHTPEAESERVQQIKIMGEVYKRASQVIAWIGEHEHESLSICQFLKVVGFASESANLNDASNWKAVETIALEEINPWMIFVDSFQQFFQRSWFTRMWPIQEVTLPLPGKVSLVCGDSSLPFEYVRSGWQVLSRIGLPPGSINLDQSVALQFYLADALALKRKHYSPNGAGRFGTPLIIDLSQLSLSSIMRATQFKTCSQAKDKFFALYGVLQELQIEHKVDVSRYTEMTEVDLFLAVFESCVAFECSLDVLRLSQSAENYIGHNDLWAKRQTPYGSIVNTLLGTFTRISPLLSHGSVDNAPSWRASLPTWVPDWTQWTQSNIDDRDIALIRSYSTRILFKRPPVNGTKSIHPGLPGSIAFHDTRRTVDIVYCTDSTIDGESELSITQNNSKHPKIRVQAKFVGKIRSVGSVDSISNLWQLVSTSLNFYDFRNEWNARHVHRRNWVSSPLPVPDAFLVSMIETIRNAVVNTILGPILLDIRGLYLISSPMTFVTYFLAIIGAWDVQPLLNTLVCSIYPSASACLVADLESTSLYWTILRKLQVCFLVFSESSSRILGLFNRQFRSGRPTAIISYAWLAWTFLPSVSNAIFGIPDEQLPRFLPESLSVLVIYDLVAIMALLLEDEVLIILSLTGVRMNTLFSVAIGFLFSPWANYTPYILAFFIILASRCLWGTGLEILGSERFMRQGSFTSGLNLFTTETGLTGNTSGSVKLFDVVIVVDRASDPMIVRRCGSEFKIVGAAYVGNKSRKELEESSESWTTIDIL